MCFLFQQFYTILSTMTITIIYPCCFMVLERTDGCLNNGCLKTQMFNLPMFFFNQKTQWLSKRTDPSGPSPPTQPSSVWSCPSVCWARAWASSTDARHGAGLGAGVYGRHIYIIYIYMNYNYMYIYIYIC